MSNTNDRENWSEERKLNREIFMDWFMELLFKQETALFREILRNQKENLFEEWMRIQPVYIRPPEKGPLEKLKDIIAEKKEND